MARRYSHVIGFDDSPFDRSHRGDVMVVGTVFSGPRLEGILSGRIERDGSNSTQVLAELVKGSRFYEQLQVVLIQGITMGGFNVIDIHGLHEALELPVVVVARKQPNLPAIRSALLNKVRDGETKWSLIEAAGPMHALAGVWVQRVGIPAVDVAELIGRLAVHGSIPEPLRMAHLIAGGIVDGHSRGRT